MTVSSATKLAILAVILSAVASVIPASVLGQAAAAPVTRPRLRAAPSQGVVRIDGRLDESAWASADSAELVQVEPREGAPPEGRTVVRVLAMTDAIVMGIRADDPDAGRLVSFARQRDASLENEDHVKLVLDSYGDGRSGYVFAVNPNGARYDALVTDEGVGENADWDAIWEAAAVRTPTGWSAEISIPLKSLLFKPGLTSWGLNVQRRIQRLQETDRWASAARNYRITQTSRAGLLTGIPQFRLGLGLAVRPSLT